MLNLSAFKRLSIGGIPMTQLTLDGTLIWQRTITNQVPLSIESDGSIYNGGLGYKQDYRIRSGGTEASSDNTICTGFIPVSPGDVIRLTGWDFSNNVLQNALNVSDSAFGNLGQFTSQPANYGIFADSCADYGRSSVTEEKSGVWKWIVPPASSGIRYIRVTGYKVASGADMIITSNEEIP